jgi:hypothetical protein
VLQTLNKLGIVIQSKQNLGELISNNFFGYLNGKSILQKKEAIVDIYHLFYRFALVKMKSFMDDPVIMIFVLKYLMDTKMTRI